MLVTMDIAGFQTLRSGLRMNASAAHGRLLAAFEGDLRAQLAGSGLFTQVEVGHDPHPDRLVVALCSFDDGTDVDLVLTALARIWAGLAFAHWESHAFLVEDGHVELQAATLHRGSRRYVTVHLVAQQTAVGDTSGVPRQRDPEADDAVLLPSQG